MPAIMSLVPLLLGIVLMLGIMGLTNTKVNFMNILVFPIIIGYGIQNGIYIYFRFLEEKEIGRTLAQVGPAVIASTLTTLVGWSTLLLAQHRGLKSIGILASIGIGATLIVAIFVLPSILEKYLDTTSNQKDTRVREMGMNFDSALEVESNENFYEDLLETQNEDLREFPLQAEEQTTTPKISKKKSKKTTSKKKSISKKKDQNQNHE
jgi:predicted RND superfamily exporter protein